MIKGALCIFLKRVNLIHIWWCFSIWHWTLRPNIYTYTCTHMFWAILYKKEIAHKFQNTFVNTEAVTQSKNKTKTKTLFPHISVSNVFFFIMMHQLSCVRNLFCAFSLFLQCKYIFHAVFLWWYAKLVGALPPIRVNTRLPTLLHNSEVCVLM